ncbi:MAG: hypothetical protein FOGNACKC_01973 [Anaerolineae bacterium]|nr:hypothetical protein [Anaerolineae bacterium]
MKVPPVWFKIQSSHEEIRRIKRLAEGRGRDMSTYIRWLLERDEQEQSETGPKQQSLFG